MTEVILKKAKNYGLAVAIALVILFGSGAIYLALENRRTYKELAIERDKYSLVLKEKERLDSLDHVRLDMVKERDKIITELRAKYRWRMAEVKNLKDSLALKNSEIDALSADSSYKYVNTVYPAVSDRIYPIDSFQVKTFHKLDINYKGELNINKTLSLALVDLKSVSDSYFLQSENYRVLYLGKKEYADIKDKENAVLNKQVKDLNKEANKQKLIKNVSNAALVGAVGYIVVKTFILK